MHSGQRTIAYQPALDGVRAVAVSLVLLFHGGVTWMSGGYVGVSVFFTLSGYLITTLLLVEFDRTGTVSVAEFYRRRLKRLMPASVLCLVAVAVMARAGLFRGVPHLRADFLGAVFQVANWTDLFRGDTYADLISRRSGLLGPLDHYWSLAIEEQFYWVWPVVMVVLLPRLRSPRARTMGVGAMAVSLIAAAPIIARLWGPSAAYWATPARLGEITVGAATACALRQITNRPQWLSWLTPAGLAAIIGAAVAWPASGGPAYAGALGVFALASAALITGLQSPSLLRQALSFGPLVWLGKVSYGVYLFHWPTYAVVNDARFAASPGLLLAIRVALTLAVAASSMWLLEQRVRRSTFAARPTMAAAGAACAAVAMASLLIPGISGYRVPSSAEAAAVRLRPVDSLAPLSISAAPESTTTTATVTAITVARPDPAPAASTTSTTAVTATTLAPLPTPARPVRILLIGDSTAQATGGGLIPWAADHPELAQVTMLAGPGCGIIREGTVVDDPDNRFKKTCDRLLGPLLDRDLTTLQPDVVVVMETLTDLADRQWNADEGFLSPLDERFRQRLADDYRWLTGRILDAGVQHIAWIRPPIPFVPWQGAMKGMADPERYAVQHSIIEMLATDHPDRVVVVELDTWLDSVVTGTGNDWRPDGLHFSPEAARLVVDDFLGDGILRVALSS